MTLRTAYWFQGRLLLCNLTNNDVEHLKNLFILFLAALGLRCDAQASQ